MVSKAQPDSVNEIFDTSDILRDCKLTTLW